MSDSGGVPSNAPDKQVTNGVVGSIYRGDSSFTPGPYLPYNSLWEVGAPMTTSSKGMCFSGLFAGHKGTEGYLRLTEKLLCEQRRNLLWLPETG